MTLEQAKQQLPIPELWQLLNLPGVPAAHCKCPFHEDGSPSFSIIANGQAFTCHAGCGKGDSVSFLQLARGLSPKDACLELIKLAGGRPERPAGTTPRPPATVAPDPLPPTRPELALGKDSGTPALCRCLAELRNVSADAVALMVTRGLLGFRPHYGQQAWLVGDRTGRNTQARRLDGKLWEAPGQPKALSLLGSVAKWPIGMEESQPFPCIALVEGGPDLLAAHHYISIEEREGDCAAVCMTGASPSIHPATLPAFKGKRVRIYGHCDDPGAKAVNRWAKQLHNAGAKVDAFSFDDLRKVDGTPIKDLNDCTYINADDFENDLNLWRMLP
jgi:hypothetical protein